MLLGFQSRFELAIRVKKKRHTIRGLRKRRPRVGEICHCYVNPRKKSMRLLGRWFCTRVQSIRIEHIADPLKRRGSAFTITIDGVPLQPAELERFADSDGFATFGEMMRFWLHHHSLPFEGDLIHWDPERPAPAPRRKQPWKSRRKRPARRPARPRGKRAATKAAAAAESYRYDKRYEGV